MITLYDAPRCPYCARVRIVLAEKRVQFDAVTVDLDDRPEWIRRLNPPYGRVPVLDEDGLVLPESVVICEFLEERYPESALLPADPGARAAARLLIERFDNLGDAYYAARRREEGGREWLEEQLAPLDAVLARSPWLTGQDFGLADSAYVPWVLRSRDLLGVELVSFPHLVDWLDRLSVRASIDEEIAIVSGLPRIG
jgi:stringent starvation protein A